MEINEIKKLLYKQKPKAKLERIYNGNAYYYTKLDVSKGYYEELISVEFVIPVSDMGEASFMVNEDAKHLIRWINIDNIIKK